MQYAKVEPRRLPTTNIFVQSFNSQIQHNTNKGEVADSEIQHNNKT